jgi:hypothetical protein
MKDTLVPVPLLRWRRETEQGRNNDKGKIDSNCYSTNLFVAAESSAESLSAALSEAI